MAAVKQYEPLISICVPTHEGRRAVLGSLLEGVAAQAREVPGLVEICVSDNASHDGTDELVAELSRNAPCPVLYRRHPNDRGLALNLLSAVALARGRYCWLLGSDDLLAERSLSRACEMLRELPGATGYVVGAVHVDSYDPKLYSRQLPRAFHPGGERSCLIEGLDAVYDQCGNAWCALSWSIVEREVWLRSVDENRELVLAHPVFPQVVIFATMAAMRPVWGWLAEPLVHQRNATTFLFEQANVSLADRWSEIIGGAASAWGAVLSGERVRWRRRMRLLNRVWGNAGDVRATKLYDKPTLRSQIRLALICLRAFWPVRTYWRDVLPATVMPVWMTRWRYAAGGWRLTRGRASDCGKVVVSGRLPTSLLARSVSRLNVVVRSDTRRSVPSAGPNAVTVGQRWSTADGRVLLPQELGLNEIAAMPQSIPRKIRAGRATKVEFTLFAPTEPGFYRVEIVAHQHGRGWFDELGESQMAAADVEVV